MMASKAYATTEQWRRDILAERVGDLIRSTPDAIAPGQRRHVEAEVERAVRRADDTRGLRRWLALTDEERDVAIAAYARLRYCLLCGDWKRLARKRKRLCSSCERAHVHFDNDCIEERRWYVARVNPDGSGLWEVVSRPARGAPIYRGRVRHAAKRETLARYWSYASRSAAITRAIALYGPQKAGE